MPQGRLLPGNHGGLDAAFARNKAGSQVAGTDILGQEAFTLRLISEVSGWSNSNGHNRAIGGNGGRICRLLPGLTQAL